MSVVAFVPRYTQPRISADEAASRAIADVLDPGAVLPQKCGSCGATPSIRNPLWMEPAHRFDNGLPKGTPYQAKCADCKERAARRR